MRKNFIGSVFSTFFQTVVKAVIMYLATAFLMGAVALAIGFFSRDKEEEVE